MLGVKLASKFAQTLTLENKFATLFDCDQITASIAEAVGKI